MREPYNRKQLIKTLLDEVEIPRFFVIAKPCAECLFSNHRLVDEERADAIIRQCRRDNVHFICHRATLAGDKNVCCYAYYHQIGKDVLEIRLAHILDNVIFVAEADFDVLPERAGDKTTGEI
jgi:hypothetical protein